LTIVNGAGASRAAVVLRAQILRRASKEAADQGATTTIG
jgi:hypothetical protein